MIENCNIGFMTYGKLDISNSLLWPLIYEYFDKMWLKTNICLMIEQYEIAFMVYEKCEICKHFF